jgi:DNA-binding transcriptional LysR family regulator
MGPRENIGSASEASKQRVVLGLGIGWKPILLIRERMGVSRPVPILPLKRRPAKTWQSTPLSHRGGGEIRKNRAACIGRPVVVR